MTESYRKCLYFNDCNKLERYTGKWKEHWYNYNGGVICRPHYKKLVEIPNRPKMSYEYWKKYYERDILFLGKYIRLTWVIRKGYCTWCPNNIHDGSCSQTQMHHYFYVPIMVWTCCEEICVKCHRNEHKRLRKLNKNKK